MSNEAKTPNAKEAKPKNGFFKKAGRFFKDLKSEYKKIVWPTKQHALNNTGVVLLFIAITAAGIWSLDFVLIKLFGLIY